MKKQFTYEVNLLCACECEWCRAILTSEPLTTARQSEKQLERTARKQGWKKIGNKWYCRACSVGPIKPTKD